MGRERGSKKSKTAVNGRKKRSNLFHPANGHIYTGAQFKMKGAHGADPARETQLLADIPGG
jgi:hypothetical protein